jgi:hypothetical protein
VPKDRKFVNPLTRPSEPTTQNTPTNTETSTQPYTDTSTYTSIEQKEKKKKQRFEDTHERLTLWVDKSLKHSFEALAEDQGISKTALMNEALSNLLGQYKK